jgi:hypothetical protein
VLAPKRRDMAENFLVDFPGTRPGVAPQSFRFGSGSSPRIVEAAVSFLRQICCTKAWLFSHSLTVPINGKKRCVREGSRASYLLPRLLPCLLRLCSLSRSRSVCWREPRTLLWRPAGS